LESICFATFYTNITFSVQFSLMLYDKGPSTIWNTRGPEKTRVPWENQSTLRKPEYPEKIGVPWENHRPVTSHWQSLLLSSGFLRVLWFSQGTLVFSGYSGFLRVLRFSQGTPVFSGYSGFLRVLRFTQCTLVFSGYSGFLRVLWFSQGTLVFSGYSNYILFVDFYYVCLLLLFKLIYIARFS
jgi:hypothetical protein